MTATIPALTLVLLPGLDGTGLLFAPLVAALDPSIKIVVVSYPASPEAGYSELEDVARGFIPPNQPYVLLGESFSGPIAVSLASKGDAHLKGLVLCASFVRSPYPGSGSLASLLLRLPLWPQSVLSHVVLGSANRPGLRPMVAQALATLTPELTRARVHAVLTVNMTNQLRKIVVPMLYLRAKHDWLVPAGAARLISRLRPEVSIIAFDAPHLLLQTAPKGAAEAIHVFLKSLQGSVVPE